MEIKNGIIIDGILYERVHEGDDVSLRKIGKVKDILIREPKPESKPEHEAIDLGLSVKWADRNIGAEKPSDYGDYFAWGEIESKSEYTRENSRINNEKGLSWGISGNPKYDAARANWGGTWCLPTRYHIDELIDKCKWEWTTQEGHNGYKITGPNGNSIFLPAAGWREGKLLDGVGEHGSYWSESVYVGASSQRGYVVRYLAFGRDVFSISWYGYGNDHGRTVRPITY